LQLAAEDPANALSWARRAQQAAERTDDGQSRVMALQSVGWVEYFGGETRGLERLVETIEAATTGGWDAVAATSYVLIVRTACRRRDYGVAEPYIRAGLEFCTARDFDVWRYYMLSWQSMTSLARGRWTDA